MTGITARATRNIPVTLTAKMACHSASDTSSTLPALSRPALRWTTSIPLRSPVICSTAAATWSGSVTSAG